MNLNADAVYEKSFSLSSEGYGCKEVDRFLDAVIEDYEMYDERIDKLESALQRFRRREVQLEELIHTLHADNEQLKRSVS